MKSATIGTGKTKGREGTSSPRKKELLGNSPQKGMQGSPKKGKISLRPGQKPLQCFRCEGWGHGWHECLTMENFNWRELMTAGVLLMSGSPGSAPTQNPKSKSLIYKILKQNNLYHNPDPLFRLVREANESIVMVEGQEARALLDSGSQLSAISFEWVKKLKLKPQQL